ncbi:MAG: hypothetical protein IJS39_16635 [Synergistaceae bacterium]|nr:hypothetical protein [Synergistaceae bacterium]
MSTALHQKTTLLFSAKILRFEYRPSPEKHITFSRQDSAILSAAHTGKPHRCSPQRYCVLGTGLRRKTTLLFPRKDTAFWVQTTTGKSHSFSLPRYCIFGYRPSPEKHTAVLRKDTAVLGTGPRRKTTLLFSAKILHF